jgi:hypothetical protein
MADLDQASEERWWVKIYLKSIQEISELQREYEVEIFRSTIRRIDNKNLRLEGYISKRLFERLKARYRVRILGDVDKLVKQASKDVSGTNRYKKQERR